MRLRNRKQENQKKQPTSKYRFETINFGAIKDFIDYGMNRELTDLKIRKLADVKTREALMKKKPETDYMKIMIFVVTALVIGLIAYMLITSFFDTQDIARQLSACIVDVGRLQAQIIKLGQDVGTTAGSLVG